QLYRSVFIHRSFLLSITTTFILADLYHMNKLEILPTAIRFAIDTIKNKYYIFPAIETTVEQANTSQ
ncbi:MAG TPA: hypothetical protein VL201_01555, partial [Patescibacteria group bacterium]|nr:hypothetical protein [Patescibacteria group bacterium]